MKKKLISIIVLCVIAIINAWYLTHLAYSELSGASFCDINSTLSCNSVLAHPAAQIFGVPFPVIALVVYPILLLISILWYTNKMKNHRTWLRRLSLGGILFNSYVISQEAFVIKAFCPLCLICTAIIITIHILTYRNKQQPIQEIVEA